MAERVRLKPQYEVGYGNPPRRTRFRKGHSGNPKGRPRGLKSFATIFDEEMNQTVTILENGKRKRIPKMRAAVRQTLNRAMRGDFKALHEIVTMLRCYDALKRVGTKQPRVPEMTSDMSLREMADIYARTLRERRNDN